MSFINLYQSLPMHLNPIAFRIGFFPIGWYSLMYVAGFLTVYFLLKWRLKNDQKIFNFSIYDLENFIFFSILGVILGGRIGYVLFYAPGYFLLHPLEIISPIDSMGNFIGIYGMSYHGGAIGLIFASILFAKKYKINFWKLADFVVPAIPAGYFFGRIGNFLNGELYGRLTSSSWGMYFYNPNFISWELRIPSQLLEALFEGLILFGVLWILRNKRYLHGIFLELYLIGYGFFRFFIEFVREPDWQIGFVGKIFGLQITLGQVYSLGMVIIALVFFLFKKLSKIKK